MALVVPDITNPYFAGVIKGAERAAAQASLTLVLADTQENPAHEEQLVRRLGPAVDGFVLMASRMPDRCCGGPRSSTGSCWSTGPAPAWPAWSPTTTTAPGRSSPTSPRSGTGRSCSSAGRPSPGRGRGAGPACGRPPREHGLEATRFGPYLPTLASGPAAADAVLAHGATAVVAHNDMLAIGVLKRLSARGVAVPGQVSVVGFDNVFGSDFCHPPLTTLAERTEEAGARAIAGLAQQVGQRHPGHPRAGAAHPPRGARVQRCGRRPALRLRLTGRAAQASPSSPSTRCAIRKAVLASGTPQ